MELHSIVGQFGFGRRKKENALIDNVVFVMQEFGYTIEEMKVMPIPTFISILDFLERRAKEEENQMRKSRRGR